MRVLSIETASTMLGAAIVGEEGLLGASELQVAKRHAELLHPLIGELLERTGTALSELSAIAVDVGPGLFTGLRVGVACAKGLAQAAGLPVVAVTSTEALIGGAALYDGPVVAVLDVRRGEVAYELPDGSGPGIGPVSEVVARVRKLAGTPLLVGTGVLAHREELEQELGGAVHLAGAELSAPAAEVLGRLGLERVRAGSVEDPMSVTIRYLRAADAAITWSTRDDEAAAGAAER